MCRVNLTRSLPILLPLIAEELNTTLADYLKECTTESYINVNCKDLVHFMNLKTTAIVFGGKEHVNDQEFLKAIAEIEDAVVGICAGLLLFPQCLRSFVRPWLPGTRQLNRIRSTIRQTLFCHRSSTAEAHTAPTVFDHLRKSNKDGEKEEEDIISKFLLLSTIAVSIVKSNIHTCF